MNLVLVLLLGDVERSALNLVLVSAEDFVVLNIILNLDLLDLLDGLRDNLCDLVSTTVGSDLDVSFLLSHERSSSGEASWAHGSNVLIDAADATVASNTTVATIATSVALVTTVALSAELTLGKATARESTGAGNRCLRSGLVTTISPTVKGSIDVNNAILVDTTVVHAISSHIGVNPSVHVDTGVVFVALDKISTVAGHVCIANAVVATVGSVIGTARLRGGINSAIATKTTETTVSTETAIRALLGLVARLGASVARVSAATADGAHALSGGSGSVTTNGAKTSNSSGGRSTRVRAAVATRGGGSVAGAADAAGSKAARAVAGGSSTVGRGARGAV